MMLKYGLCHQLMSPKGTTVDKRSAVSLRGRPVITQVTMNEQTIRATITFKDGHRVILEGFTKGGGYELVEDLKRFFLFAGEVQVVEYNARFKIVGPHESRFVQIADGYTVERVIEYWETVISYMNRKYFWKENADDTLHWPAMLSYHSHHYLLRVKDGDFLLP